MLLQPPTLDSWRETLWKLIPLTLPKCFLSRASLESVPCDVTHKETPQAEMGGQPHGVATTCSPESASLDDAMVQKLRFKHVYDYGRMAHVDIAAAAVRQALEQEEIHTESKAYEDQLLHEVAIANKKVVLQRTHERLIGRGLRRSEFNELFSVWKEFMDLQRDAEENKVSKLRSHNKCSSSTWTWSPFSQYVTGADEAIACEVRPPCTESDVELAQARLLEALSPTDDKPVLSIGAWVAAIDARITDSLACLGMSASDAGGHGVSVTRAEQGKARGSRDPPRGALQDRCAGSIGGDGYRIISEGDAHSVLESESPKDLGNLLRSLRETEEMWFPASLSKAQRQSIHKGTCAAKGVKTETWRGPGGVDRVVAWRETVAVAGSAPGEVWQPEGESELPCLQTLSASGACEAVSRIVVDTVLLSLYSRLGVRVGVEEMLSTSGLPRACSDYVLSMPTQSLHSGLWLGAVEVKRCTKNGETTLRQAVVQNGWQLLNMQMLNKDLSRSDSRKWPSCDLPILGVSTDGRRWVCMELQQDLKVFRGFDLTRKGHLLELLAFLAQHFRRQEEMLKLTSESADSDLAGRKRSSRVRT